MQTQSLSLHPMSTCRTLRLMPPSYATPSARRLATGRAATNNGGGLENEWAANTELYEYVKASNPALPPVPITAWPSSLHEHGPSRVVPLSLKEDLGLVAEATSPNLAAAFIRVQGGESVDSRAAATSQAFVVIRGAGSSTSEFGSVRWKAGDAFVLPATVDPVTHIADPVTRTSDDSSDGCDNGAALYWINDAPLLRYLGVAPSEPKFPPAFYKLEDLKAKVKEFWADPHAAKKNRIGTLLGNTATANSTKTLTHTLWGLYNVLPAHSVQQPHRHAACALDLCTEGPAQGCYTLMGPELDDSGSILDGVKVPWAPGAAFSTPPGWWHSHHNDTDQDAWVLPVQDAALYTYQRTLDIRFAAAEVDALKHKHLHGPSAVGENVKL